jgi:hypothetical protein
MATGRRARKHVMTLSSPNYQITIKKPWCDKNIERWLVETFEMWPHPNAPMCDGEHNYPEFRKQSYELLMMDLPRDKLINFEFYKEEIGASIGHTAGLARVDFD